ncbi:MAG: methyltransferase [Myxococcota bacterium]|nr:methyltransferase [Myxococcota bacterium]
MKVFEHGQTPLELRRFGGQDSGPLRAWDAADELVVDYLREQKNHVAEVLFVNDAFGALTLCQGEWASETFTDSHCSQLAIVRNALNNSIEVEGLRLLNSIDQVTIQPTHLVVKIPKRIELLEYQLMQLSKTVLASTKIILAGMVKHTPRAVFDISMRWLSAVQVHRAQRKARLIEGRNLSVPSGYVYKPSGYRLPGLGLSITSHPQLFSAGKLDHASRLLISFFASRNETNVLDLGCGTGVLGLAYASHHPKAAVSFTDESKTAVRIAELNWNQNGFEPNRGTFEVDDCLEKHPCGHYDLVVCNPPFHLGHSVETSTARRMFVGARRCLSSGGRFLVVANRHLGYHRQLKELFSTAKTISSDPRFVVIESVKK